MIAATVVAMTATRNDYLVRGEDGREYVVANRQPLKRGDRVKIEPSNYGDGRRVVVRKKK